MVHKNQDSLRIYSSYFTPDNYFLETDKRGNPLSLKPEQEKITLEETFSPKEEVESTKKENGSLDESAASRAQNGPPVVAQIEVLYELNQTGKPKGRAKKTLMDDDEEEEVRALVNKAVNPERVLVATFEGWFNGGPDGGLRWRITHMRTPQWEFPDLASPSI